MHVICIMQNLTDYIHHDINYTNMQDVCGCLLCALPLLITSVAMAIYSKEWAGLVELVDINVSRFGFDTGFVLQLFNLDVLVVLVPTTIAASVSTLTLDINIDDLE